MDHVDGCIDLQLLPKKIFCETFPWDCRSEFIDSKAGFKIIIVENITE